MRPWQDLVNENKRKQCVWEGFPVERALNFQAQFCFQRGLAVLLILLCHFSLLVWSHLFAPSVELLVPFCMLDPETQE